MYSFIVALLFDKLVIQKVVLQIEHSVQNGSYRMAIQWQEVYAPSAWRELPVTAEITS